MFNKNRLNKYQNNLTFEQQNQHPQLENERLLLEIKENRRRINNLAKRIVRLENYLRIRDTNDYSILDEENDYFK